MRWSKQNARKRDTRITVRQAPSGRDAYADGRIVSATTFTTIEFWGDVEDLRDTGRDIAFNAGQRLDSRFIRIMADSESTKTVNISDTLTLDTSPDERFEIIDKYDSKFRYESVIIAKFKD